MKSIKYRLILLAVLGSSAVHLHALEVKPGGILFAHYEFVTSNHLQNGTTVQNYNAFEVSRIYLNAEAKYDDKISAFLQLEANLTSRDNKNNRVYLKNAELRFNFHPAAKLSAGIVAVPWRGFEEGIWKHRFVSKVLEDLEGLFAGSDRGIRLSGEVPFLAYDAMIGNGEGTGGDGTSGNESPTNNGGGRLKDYTLKLAVSPFQAVYPALEKLKINLLAHKGNRNENQLRDRMFGGVSYESKYANFMLTYFNGDNGTNLAPSRTEGFSIHSVIIPAEKYNVFLRFDRADPNIHSGGDIHNRYIYGLTYQLIKGVRVAVDHQYLQQERRSFTLQDESILFVHTEAKF